MATFVFDQKFFVNVTIMAPTEEAARATLSSAYECLELPVENICEAEGTEVLCVTIGEDGDPDLDIEDDDA